MLQCTQYSTQLLPEHKLSCEIACILCLHTYKCSRTHPAWVHAVFSAGTGTTQSCTCPPQAPRGTWRRSCTDGWGSHRDQPTATQAMSVTCSSAHWGGGGAEAVCLSVSTMFSTAQSTWASFRRHLVNASFQNWCSMHRCQQTGGRWRKMREFRCHLRGSCVGGGAFVLYLVRNGPTGGGGTWGPAWGDQSQRTPDPQTEWKGKGGGRMGKTSDIEECHTYSTMKLYSANLYHFNHTIWPSP